MKFRRHLQRNTLGSLLLLGTLGLTSLIVHSTSPEIRKGEYQGFPVQASIEGKTKKVILQSKRNYPQGRIIGVDYSNVKQQPKDFKPIFLYINKDDPIRELANPNDLERAWKKVYSK